MLDKCLEQIAEKIIKLDEASLTQLLPFYKKKMETFEPSDEWEKSVVIFFLINAVRVKNAIFNENIVKQQTKKKTAKDKKADLKLVKGDPDKE